MSNNSSVIRRRSGTLPSGIVVYAGSTPQFSVIGNNGTTWSQVSTPPIDIEDISFINDNEGFIVRSNQGIYFTNDGCATWSLIFNDLVNTNGFITIRVHPTERNIIYAGAQLTGIPYGPSLWVSRNKGGSWEAITSAPKIHIHDIAFVGEMLIIFGVEPASVAQKIYKSQDGFIWTDITHAETTSPNISGFFIDSSTGLVCSGDKVYRTTNGGTNWTNVTPTITLKTIDSLVGIAFLSSTIGIICGICHDTLLGTQESLIIRTTNGGSTWSRQATVGTNILNDAVFISSTVGWCVGNATIQKTVNGGTVWVVETPPSGSGNISCITDVGQNVYVPTLASLLVTGDNSDHRRSTDEGDTITEITPDVVMQNDDIFVKDSSIAFLTGRTSDLAKIFRSTNAGAAWSAVYTGAANSGTVRAIDFLSATNGFAVVYDNVGNNEFKIFKSTDTGATWADHDIGYTRTGEPFDLKFFDSSRGIITLGENNKIVRTVNGGVSWIDILLGFPSNYGKVVSIPKAVAGLAFMTTNVVNTILKSTDYGAVWSSVSVSISGLTITTITGIAFLDASKGYITGTGTISGINHTFIAETTNGGTLWVLKTLIAYDPLVYSPIIQEIWFKNINTGFAVQDFGGIIRTTDGGASWIIVQPALLANNFNFKRIGAF